MMDPRLTIHLRRSSQAERLSHAGLFATIGRPDLPTLVDDPDPT
jgi:hypothetical protein